MNEQITNAFNLATIATWVMIIGIAVLVYVSEFPSGRRKHHKSTKK